VIREFFAFVGYKHESTIIPEDGLRWRDDLMTKGLKASTVALKLSVLRSFFEYLKAYGHVTLNPTSTKLVSPPMVPEALAGRALVSKEAPTSSQARTAASRKAPGIMPSSSSWAGSRSVRPKLLL
jgi:site-specific recombinase XerC